MNEYIERDKLIDDLTQLAKYQTGERQQAILGVIETVRLRKAADVAPAVPARWKYYKKQNIAVCTNCSFERDLDLNFGRAISCPNCGAKMDGDTK